MNFLVEARRLAQKKFNDARAVIAAQAEWPVGSDSQNPDQGFVKGEEFFRHFVTFFSESLLVEPNHTLILLNQSGASTSEFVRSLSAYESK